MFNKTHMVILESEERVDTLMRIASNHDLVCLYKIGVYGKEHQHELFIKGSPWNYHAFLKEVDPKKKKREAKV